MNADRQYDSNLQMFVEAPREPDFARLAFLRWLGERGRLEHEIAGPSSGPLHTSTVSGLKPKTSIRLAL